VLYAAYIINRTPKIGNDKTRFEMIFGKKPSLEKTLDFGMPVMFHNHDPHIKKLHDRAFQGVFLGFWEEDHTYKIFNNATNELISTRTIHAYPQHQLDFENNDWEERFRAEDDDFWQSSLTNQQQYLFFNQYQLLNNDNPNNNVRNQLLYGNNLNNDNNDNNINGANNTNNN